MAETRFIDQTVEFSNERTHRPNASICIYIVHIILFT